MSDELKKPEIDNASRYMALLALTAQDLPVRTLHATDTYAAGSFEILDGDPAALEVFLRRDAAPRSAVVQQKRPRRVSLKERLAELFYLPSVRYAAAFGVAALVSVLVLTQLTRQDRLAAVVEKSYSGITLATNQSALVLPWERPRAAMGFAPNAMTNSPGSIEFGRGLLHAKQVILSGSSATIGESSYHALGEWNLLLWTASESAQRPQSKFWRSQQEVGRRLAAAQYDDRESAELIEGHLARVDGLLTALSSDQNSARNARALADELLLFREQFAPHDKTMLE